MKPPLKEMHVWESWCKIFRRWRGITLLISYRYSYFIQVLSISLKSTYSQTAFYTNCFPLTFSMDVVFTLSNYPFTRMLLRIYDLVVILFKPISVSEMGPLLLYLGIVISKISWSLQYDWHFWRWNSAHAGCFYEIISVHKHAAGLVQPLKFGNG